MLSYIKGDMMYKLFLDDERNPEDVNWVKNVVYDSSWVIVRNMYDFFKVIEEKGLPEEISFDHNLGKFGFNGFDILKILCYRLKEIYKPSKLPNMYFHSMNLIDRANMFGFYELFKKHY